MKLVLGNHQQTKKDRERDREREQKKAGEENNKQTNEIQVYIGGPRGPPSLYEIDGYKK